MDTVYPNRRKRFPETTNLPSFGAIDIGGGFTGFSAAPSSGLVLDATGFVVVSQVTTDVELKISKPAKGFLAIY